MKYIIIEVLLGLRAAGTFLLRRVDEKSDILLFEKKGKYISYYKLRLALLYSGAHSRA